MRKIVEAFPRHGSERTHRVLTGPDAFGGWKVNFKRMHRIWKEEHMQVPRQQRKRLRLPGASINGCVRHRALHRNHVWSYGFLTERTEDGRQLRILVVIDEFTRECLAIEVARSFTARDVIMTRTSCSPCVVHRSICEAITTLNSLPKRSRSGWQGRASARFTSRRRALVRTATWRASTAGGGHAVA
jgi:hypothetical protein